LYRLETIDQIIAAGLEEYFHPAGVAVIEWAERWFGSQPDSTLNFQKTIVKTPFRQVHIETAGETERRIIYEDFGG